MMIELPNFRLLKAISKAMAFEEVQQMIDILQKDLHGANNQNMSLMKENSALHDEKKMLEQKIGELELNKTKITCAHCQTALQSTIFCSSDCGEYVYLFMFNLIRSSIAFIR